jgi:hypothetical protein
MDKHGKVWDTWIAVNPDIPALSCPWTLRILDYKYNKIDFGTDDVIIKSSETLLNPSSNTRLTVSTANNDIEADSILQIRKDSYITSCKVIRKSNSHIEVQGNIDVPTESVICNMSRQIHVILTANVSTST